MRYIKKFLKNGCGTRVLHVTRLPAAWPPDCLAARTRATRAIMAAFAESTIDLAVAPALEFKNRFRGSLASPAILCCGCLAAMVLVIGGSIGTVMYFVWVGENSAVVRDFVPPKYV